MDLTTFYYCGMWGALQGNIAYECAYGGRDLLPAQIATQTALRNLYCEARDSHDAFGGRAEGLDVLGKYQIEWSQPKTR